MRPGCGHAVYLQCGKRVGYGTLRHAMLDDHGWGLQRGSSWVWQYLPKRNKPQPKLSPEDAATIAEELAYLRALGCTREQIERRRANLQQAALAKSICRPKRRKPADPLEPNSSIVREKNTHPFRMQLAQG